MFDQIGEELLPTLISKRDQKENLKNRRKFKDVQKKPENRFLPEKYHLCNVMLCYAVLVFLPLSTCFYNNLLHTFVSVEDQLFVMHILPKVI